MLKIERLTLTYANGVHALNDVSLTIAPGVFGLLGPNGAGKSSLMRTLATLQRPDAGSIYLNGIDALRNPDRIREQLGYLPQDFGLYPAMTVEAQLRHLVSLKLDVSPVICLQHCEELLRKTNLWGVRSRRLAELSGGMRQRFGIAQALIGKPALIIVDEPTAGLDPEERLRVLDLLAEAGDHAAVILSTHIVEDVADICSSMAVLNKGRVIVHGTPADAIDAIRGKVWEATMPRAAATAAAANFDVLCTRFSAGKFSVQVAASTRPAEEFNAIEPTLAHVYFQHLPAEERRRAA